jgi:hypothetical protein
MHLAQRNRLGGVGSLDQVVAVGFEKIMQLGENRVALRQSIESIFDAHLP